MPEKELENTQDYVEYIDSLFWKSQEQMCEYPETEKEYWYYYGKTSAYSDCSFWFQMIGRPIPRD